MQTNTKRKRALSTFLCFILLISFVITGCGDATGDGEKEIGEQEYGFIVLNQKGEVLSGVQVTFDGNTVTTGSDGTAAFAKPQTETVELSASCLDYYDYSNASYQVKDGAVDIITLQPRSLESHRLKSAEYKNTDALIQPGVDLLTKYKRVNMSTPNLDFNITTSVLGDEDTVTKYELHQMTDGTDKVISTSTDGTFQNVKVSDFSVGTNVYVSVYDNNNHQTSTALNLEIGANPNVTEFSEISFGDGISFAVADEGIQAACQRNDSNEEYIERPDSIDNKVKRPSAAERSDALKRF